MAPRMEEGWIADPERGGGPLLFIGCHLVDLMLWLVGEEPERVSAMVTRAETGVDDTSAIRLEFAGGLPAELLVSQSAAGFGYELRVIGRAGSITLRGRDFVHYEIEVHSTASTVFGQPTLLPVPSDSDPIDTMFAPELDEFADAIAQGRPPAITASDAHRVLRVLDAVVEAGRTGQAVSPGAPMLAAF